jgi:hypothetical protein
MEGHQSEMNARARRKRKDKEKRRKTAFQAKKNSAGGGMFGGGVFGGGAKQSLPALPQNVSTNITIEEHQQEMHMLAKKRKEKEKREKEKKKKKNGAVGLENASKVYAGLRT